MTDRPTIDLFDRRDGELLVGGVPAGRLAERVGTTPFFAYDRALLTARISRVRSALPADVELGYAVKANPMPAVLHHLSRLVDGFDVASATEMREALNTPMPAERVSFAGPGKTPAELAQAVAAGVVVEIESVTEAERVVAQGDRQGVTPRVALRVNPDFSVAASGMRMGGGPQQFGVDAESAPDLLRWLAGTGVDLLGLHVFAGSQNLRADLLCEAQRRTVDLAVRLAGETSLDLRYLNIGGGFGVPYFARDRPLDLTAVGDNLARLLADEVRPRFPAARVVVELGRYLVSECGVYVTRVLDRKQSRGKTFLVVDGGLHHQLAASGNFGQVIRRDYPLALANRMDPDSSETVTVVGCLCTPLDLLGADVTLPVAVPGDLVAVFHAGAYGLTASPTAFLSHPPPPEVLL
ncbi:pyridoxal-dependent decarboxylase, exosortase A system-associated [Micromonospora echinospora]|uniref:pyridoxal-dependent decarboxylase, exosortase A system-associated n=1 Tax=Micromonospora echinospora TaxID=1877 RepID=UPI003796BC43